MRNIASEELTSAVAYDELVRFIESEEKESPSYEELRPDFLRSIPGLSRSFWLGV
jgi:hypothetical protein